MSDLEVWKAGIQSWPYQISDAEFLCSCMMRGDPVPAPRPRVARFGTYMPKPYQVYRKALSWSLKSHWKPFRGDSFLEPNIANKDRRFGVRAFFFRKTRQRSDVDNLLKTILDAGSHILWPDDSQVVEVFARVFRDTEQPRVQILVYEVLALDLNVCTHCGKRFGSSSGRASQKYCGTECVKAARKAKQAQRTCEHCAKPFRYPVSLERNRPLRFCSRSCIMAFYRKKRLQHYSPKPCADCGERLSRPEYVRCRACRLAERRGQSSAYRWVRPA